MIGSAESAVLCTSACRIIDIYKKADIRNGKWVKVSLSDIRLFIKVIKEGFRCCDRTCEVSGRPSI